MKMSGASLDKLCADPEARVPPASFMAIVCHRSCRPVTQHRVLNVKPFFICRGEVEVARYHHSPRPWREHSRLRLCKDELSDTPQVRLGDAKVMHIKEFDLLTVSRCLNQEDPSLNHLSGAEVHTVEE